MTLAEYERKAAEMVADHFRKRFGDGVEVVGNKVRVTNRAAVVREFGDLETQATPWVYGLIYGSSRGNPGPG